MVFITRKNITYACALLGLVAQNMLGEGYGMEFRPFRPGVVLIGGIESAIAELKHQNDVLESEAVGVPSLKEELAKAQEDLAHVKNDLGIAILEMQIAGLKAKFDGFAQRFFKTAQTDGVYFYNTLNEKIADIFNDPEIARRLGAIIGLRRDIAELQEKKASQAEIDAKLTTATRMRQEIDERTTIALQAIKDLGQQINLMTIGDQRGLNTIKNQINMIEQQLQMKLSSQEVQDKLKPYGQKVADIQQKINNLLALSFTEARLNLIAQNNNKIRQYELLLEYLRDPAAITSITTSKILGKD